ncbi:MAG: methylated-DNA--[protein]-cysteine S-methyltransferase [Saprospiraceae bacterium]
MKGIETSSYQIIAKAIEYIQSNFKNQPSLDEIAEHVHMSPFHFQRLFQTWAGTSPKKFIQHISLNYAKHLISEKQLSLFETAIHTGLSGTGRLHDLFLKIESMTPGDYKRGGSNMTISFGMYETHFGITGIASTDIGLCYLHFDVDRNHIFNILQKEFPAARIVEQASSIHFQAVDFIGGIHPNQPLKLHIKGSPFQLKVWEALLKLPEGKLESYQSIAKSIGSPTASRAIGTAIGKNPIAFLIPCHRVIRGDGDLGGYRWGLVRKTTLISKELTT